MKGLEALDTTVETFSDKIEVSVDFIDENSIVFFHDFRFRPWYQTILKWYKVVEIIDTLAVLRRK